MDRTHRFLRLPAPGAAVNAAAFGTLRGDALAPARGMVFGAALGGAAWTLLAALIAIVV